MATVGVHLRVRGPMIHAKTVVADGWWSKVGSTNLNFSSLAANSA